MEGGLCPSGLPLVGSVPWGTHLGHFYRTREDLEECLVPYFETGLSNNELCLWVASEPLRAGEARRSLGRRVPELRSVLESGQIEILDFEDWHRTMGRTDIATTLAAWKEREEAAIRRGFAGLRVTGNASWLGGKDFVKYESKFHQSFHDRRMLALCSYTLDACGLDDVDDILRNHEFTLLRQSGRWELAHSATAVVNSLEAGGRDRARHEVQFYEDRSFLASKIAQHLDKGLRRGEGILIVSEESTAAPLWVELRKRGLDPDGPRKSGQIVYLEARDVLSRLFEGGSLDSSRFDVIIGDLVSRMTFRHGSVLIYGELVNVLLQAGGVGALLELERLWNQLLVGKPATLLCGYDLSGFASADVLRDVSERHQAVHPAEGLADLDDVPDASRLMGELQHRALLLDFESRARRKLERDRGRLLRAERRARAQAELAMAHLGRLQAVTAAFSEAATPAEIAGVMVNEMARAASADEGILAIPTEDGRRLKLLGHRGHQGSMAEVAEDFGELPAGALIPVAEAFRSGRSIWLRSPGAIEEGFPELRRDSTSSIACLPLHLKAKRMGAFQFGFEKPRDFTPADRVFLHDLSRQAALALDRSVLLQHAQKGSHAKDEFMAMLGHELRNPLSPIVTSLQILRLRGGEAAFGPELDIIERQVRNLVRLVDDLLDISRITQGRVSIEPETIETAQLIARAVELARPLIEQRLHRLRVSVAPLGLALPVDAARIAQALSNILINAAKYTEPGGDIEVGAVREGAEIAIRIRDNGPGIPRELLPRLFDLFVQGQRTPDRRQGGLGIGLTVARSLVELHGGQISASSDLGTGSEFTIRLPDGFGASVPPKETPRLKRTEGLTPMDGHARVLIVDDNEDGANTLAQGLRSLGHEVAVAHHPASGLAMAGALVPEFALIDIGLPSMDGYELGRRLRSLEGLERLRLIAITGYGSEDDRIRSRAAGFEAHLVKPVEFSILKETLKPRASLGS